MSGPPPSIPAGVLTSAGLGFDGGAGRGRGVKRVADGSAAISTGDAMSKRLRPGEAEVLISELALVAASDGNRGKHGGHRQGTKNYVKDEAEFVVAYLQVRNRSRLRSRGALARALRLACVDGYSRAH